MIVFCSLFTMAALTIANRTWILEMGSRHSGRRMEMETWVKYTSGKTFRKLHEHRGAHMKRMKVNSSSGRWIGKRLIYLLSIRDLYQRQVLSNSSHLRIIIWVEIERNTGTCNLDTIIFIKLPQLGLEILIISLSFHKWIGLTRWCGGKMCKEAVKSINVISKWWSYVNDVESQGLVAPDL